MNTDRPSHDETLLAELAALDESLRQPDVPAPPPPASAPSPAPAGHPDSSKAARSPLPAGDRKVPSQDRKVPLHDGVPLGDRVRSADRDRIIPSRDRLVRPRKPVALALDRSGDSRDHDMASRQMEMEALRAYDGRRESMARLAERGLRVVTLPLSAAAAVLSSRGFRLGVLGLGALGVGLLIGWNAVKFVVPAPPPESTIIERPAPQAPVDKVPGGASRATRRAALPPVRRPAAAPPPGVGESRPGVFPPAAAASADASTIVAELPSAPAPSIDMPLTGAPLPAAPSLTPSAPPAVAAAGAIAAAAVAADERAIETTLRRYEEAYEHLDAKAAVEVWPTVDQRALSRAFAGLASQSLDIRGCEVIVRAGASTATASCSGTAEYVRKVGDTRVRVEPRQWTFTLNKTQGAWRIEAVDGSR